MSYCVCGGYLGSGRVDSYSGRWCRCASPKLAPSGITTSEFILPTYQDYYEPSEEDNRIRELEALLREIRNELSPFTHEYAILDVSVKIKKILGE